MEISIAQNVAGQIQELLQISCIFLQIGLHFLAFLLRFNFSYKNGFAFFALFLHFLHPDFWGSIFQLHFFLHFSPKYLFLLFSRKRQQPDHTTLVERLSEVEVVLPLPEWHGQRQR